MSRAARNTGPLDELIIVITTVGAIVCLYSLSLDYFVRLDLTANKAHTLSDATESTLAELEDQVTITAFFSSGLEGPYKANQDHLEDLLHEYRAASGGKLSFEFIDPLAEETAEDKEVRKEVKRTVFGQTVREPTSVEKDLERKGIQKVKIPFIKEDEQRFKIGYMGVEIRYQEEAEVIPLIQDTSTIEYDLTSMIRRLTAIKVPVLGVLQGHGEVSMTEEMQKLIPLFEQNFEVKPVELEDKPDVKVPDDIDALFIIGTKQPYSENQKKAIDLFLLEGKAAAFFLDRMDVDLQSFNPTAVEHGWGDLLAAYGIEFGGDLIADVRCSQLSIQERRGFMVITQPVKYPFIPMLAFGDQTHPVTKGLTEVPLAFTAPLFLKTDLEGVTVKSLAKSSEESWLEPAEAQKLDPRREYKQSEITFTGPYDMAATARGKLPSAYGQTPPAPVAKEGESAPTGQQEARVFVAGTANVARGSYLSPVTATLLLNVADWMLLDPAMLEMRNRAIADPPIDDEVSYLAKQGIKVATTVASLFVLIIFAVALWMRRNARRRNLA